jgi:hypothetical protein
MATWGQRAAIFTPIPENELKKETHTKNDMSLQKAYKIKLSI